MSNTVLDPERVDAVFMDCLFKDGEDISNHVKAEGITRNVGFHPDRLQSHKAEIEAMLDELPDQFKESSGGGWSFLNACNDKHGNQWTGFHQRMEQLFQLGIGIGKVKLLLPREMWSALPGGMPYYVVTTDGKMSMCVKGVLPLDQEHHRTIVEEFYSSNPDLGFPEEVIEYHSWDEVVDNPNLTEKTCVFVDGGITGGPINLGRAILINDGGIIKHSIECGLFHKDGGIIEEEVDIIQTLSHSEK